MPGQKPPDGLPPLLTPEPLPVPPLPPLPPEPPPGEVPPLLGPPEPPVWVVVALELLVVVVVGCVVDVEVVDDWVLVVVGCGGAV